MRHALLICLCTFAGLLLLPRTHAQSASTVVDEAVIAPYFAAPFMETNASIDHFANSPSYALRSRRQVLVNGNRGGDWDTNYAANVKVAWNEEALFFRLDVSDDSRVTAPAEGTPTSGDSMTLAFRYRTAGANSRASAPWLVHLYPNFATNQVRVVVEPGDKATGTRLGVIEAKMFVEQSTYTVIVRIPYAGWQDPPRPATQMRFQLLFADDDNAEVAGIDQLFALFPVSSSREGAITSIANYGDLHFVGDLWLDIRAEDILFDSNNFIFRLRYGNMTSEERTIAIEVQPNEPGAPLIKTFENVQVMKPMTRRDEILHELSMADLPPNSLVRLRAVSGLYDAPTKPIIHSVRNIIYLPAKIERQRNYPTRDLPIYRNRVGLLETFQQMAGGGRVLWNVGRYDASSREIPERLRDKGTYTVQVPNATANDLPWALFGGQDHLDNMAEPLVLNMLPQVFASADALAPRLPEFPYLENDRRHQRKAIRSTRLLLIGLCYDYAGPDAMPEIVVSAGRRELAREKLISTPAGGVGSRHTYVLRIWLEEATEYSQITIANVAEYGPRAELDFLALLGGSDPIPTAPGAPSLSFDGSPAARIFTQQLATSLFFMRNYLISSDGECYQSLPGGRGGMAAPADIGLFMEELAAWGALTEAERLARRMPVIMRPLHDQFLRRQELTVGYPAMLIGLHELWRKNPSYNVRGGWLSTVHQPVTDLVNAVNRHPLSLVNAVGPYGINHPTRQGTTHAMAVATEAALRAAANLTSAPQVGYRQSGSRWLQEAERIPDRIRNTFAAPAGNLRLRTDEPYAGGYGLPAQPNGVNEELPAKAWLFGRYQNRDPVLFNDGLRVYDTPHVFSALPFYMSSGGFRLNDEIRTELNTTLNYLYIMSPLFQGSTRPVFLNQGILEYDTSDIQLFTIMAAALADNMPITTKLLNGYVAYTFDEYAPLPDAPGRRADAEISPYTFEQRLNVSPTGENLGASMDDLNVRTGTLALRVARLLAGIDDTNMERLQLFPRLPDGWGSLAADNWLVSHGFRNSSVQPISYSYERINRMYSLTISCPEPIRQLQVRFGPYPRNVRRVQITGPGISDRVTTVEEGAHTWAYKSLRNVTEIDLQCRPVN